MENEPRLTDGGEWRDHEDCLIGNEQGLKNLISACNMALDNGEYYGNGLGDYVGVKKLENSWFEKPEDSKSSKIGTAMLGVVLAGAIALILIGMYTIIRWLF